MMTKPILATLALAALAACPIGVRAESGKLDLSYLTPSQQREMWTRTDDYAGYEALLHLCGKSTDFERRFVSAVRPCVASETIAKVVHYYRDRYAFTLAHANKRPCDDPYFAQHGLAEKLRTILETQVSRADSYCKIYQKTKAFDPN